MLCSRPTLYALGAICVTSLAACDAKEPAAEQGQRRVERPVLVSSAHYAAQSQTREFVATIRPRIESDQGFRVAGKVVKRFVEIGQRVKAGDPIAALDEQDLRLQKEQADAEFGAARMAQTQALADETARRRIARQGLDRAGRP